MEIIRRCLTAHVTPARAALSLSVVVSVVVVPSAASAPEDSDTFAHAPDRRIVVSGEALNDTSALVIRVLGRAAARSDSGAGGHGQRQDSGNPVITGLPDVVCLEAELLPFTVTVACVGEAIGP